MKNYFLLKLTAVILVVLALPFAFFGCKDGGKQDKDNALPTPDAIIEGSTFELTPAQKEIAAEIIKNLYGAEPIDIISVFETKLPELYLYNLYSSTLEEYENGYGRITCEEADAIAELVFGNKIAFKTLKSEPLPDIYAEGDYYYIKLSDNALPEVTIESVARIQRTLTADLTESVHSVGISYDTGEALTFYFLPHENENGFIVRAILERTTN